MATKILQPGTVLYKVEDGLTLTKYIYMCGHIDRGYHILVNNHNREPARMSDDEVQKLFTNYAEAAEKLAAGLEYRARELRKRASGE